MLVDDRAIFGLIARSDKQTFRAEYDRVQAKAELKKRNVLFWRKEYKDQSVFLGKINPLDDERKIIHSGNLNAVLTIGELYNRYESIDLRAITNAEDQVLINPNLTSPDDLLSLLPRLNGAYAISLWNHDRKELILACDSKGDTHLYYHAGKNHFWFSTWLKLFTSKESEIDKRGVEQFLRFFYLAPPQTIYKNVFKLEPGHYLNWKNGRVTIKPYTIQNNFNRLHALENRSSDSLLDEFDSLMLSSVEKRFRGKKVGIFLSGGIDSAVIAAACQKLYPDNTKVYTVGFNNPKLDESSLASAYARYLELPHKIFNYEMSDYFYSFDEMSKGFDQPFGDPACLPVLLTCRDTAGEIDVMTGGSGGDDLFGSHIERHVLASFYIGKFIPERLRSKIGNQIYRMPNKKITRYGTLFDFEDPEELFIMWDGWKRTELEKILGRSVDLSQSTFYKLFNNNKQYGAQVVHDILHVYPTEDSRLETVGKLGLSYLMPYHDADVLNFVHNLPKPYRYQKKQAKVLLHMLFYRYFPKKYWGVSKHTFNIPLIEILRFNNYELVNRYLNRKSIQNAGLVNDQTTIKWIEQFKEGDTRLLLKMWSLLVLHGWYYNR